MLTGSGTVPRRCGGEQMPVPSWWQDSTSEALQALTLRPTDVVLCSWPKSGTHWVYRAVRLLTGVAEAPMVRFRLHCTLASCG